NERDEFDIFIFSIFLRVIFLVKNNKGQCLSRTGADCLSSIVSAGKQDLLAWSTEPQLTMKTLFDVASRLLDPDLESSGSFCVGTYIVQLILHFPSEIALHIRELLAALMRRMQSCEIASLKSSLIVVFARLIHSSVPNVEHLINMMLNLPANGHTNCFAYVMTEWTRQQGEIQGAYQIKVTTSALALLLSTKSAALANINVQGHPLKTNTGITTRSKSKVVPDQWSIVPLPVKLVSLLSDTLIEIQEQVLVDNNEDSECEEVYKQSSNDIHDNILFSSALLDSKLTDENLDAMAKVFDESVDNDDYGAGLLKADPLNEINLVNYLGGFFANFSKTDNLTFSQLCQSLSQSQKTAIAKILDNQIPS
ncbi:Importin beta-2 subunit family protein, partial [Zostera marina]